MWLFVIWCLKKFSSPYSLALYWKRVKKKNITCVPQKREKSQVQHVMRVSKRWQKFYIQTNDSFNTTTHALCFYTDIEGILILLMNSKYFTWVKNTQCVINFSPASLSQRYSPFARAMSPAYCVYHTCVCVCVRAHDTVLSLPKDVAAVAV